MKELFKEYFYIPKNGKIREKVLLARIAVSVAIILVCLAAVSFTAFAYFSHNVSSGAQTLTGASYQLEITAPDGLEAVGDYYILDNTGGSDTVTYEFTVARSEKSSVALGYCTIEAILDDKGTAVDETLSYHTQPIGFYENAEGETVNDYNRPITLSVEIPAEKTVKIKFIPQWGTYSATDKNEIIIDDGYIINPTEGSVSELAVNILNTNREAGASADNDTQENISETPTEVPDENSTPDNTPVEDTAEDTENTDGDNENSPDTQEDALLEETDSGDGQTEQSETDETEDKATE